MGPAETAGNNGVILREVLGVRRDLAGWFGEPEETDRGEGGDECEGGPVAECAATAGRKNEGDCEGGQGGKDAGGKGEQGEQGGHPASPPAAAQGRREGEAGERSDGEQIGEIDLGLDAEQGILPAADRRENHRDSDDETRARTGGECGPEQGGECGGSGGMKRGVEDDLGPRCPASVENKEPKIDEAREQEAMFVMGLEQIAQTQCAVHPRPIQPDGFEVPFVPEGQGGAPDLGQPGPARKHECGEGGADDEPAAVAGSGGGSAEHRWISSRWCRASGRR